MSYVIDATIGVDLTAVGIGSSTAQKLIPAFALGTKLKVNDGVYQYLQVAAATTIAQYELVKIGNDFTAIAGTTTNIAVTDVCKLGVQNMNSTALTAGQCAWFFVGPGLVTVLCAASCVQNVVLFTTGTQGVVDDESNDTSKVVGLKLIATITTAAASPCVAEAELCTIGLLTTT